jgi:hypothetical protein
MDGLDHFTFWEVIQCRRDPDTDLGQDGIYRLANPWNCSVPTALKSATGIDCGGSMLVALLGGTAVLAYRTTERGPSEVQLPVTSCERVVLAAALGCVIPMLAAPLVWAHYHLLCVPLVLWVVRKVMATESDCPAPQLYRSVATLTVLLLSVVSQAMGLGRQANELIFANVAMILLLGLGFHDLATTGGVPYTRRSPRMDPPQHDDLVVGMER